MLGLDLKELMRRLPDASAYMQRVESGVCLLAEGCGRDASAELARFRACHDRLAAAATPPAAAPDLGALGMAQALAPSLPITYELVLGYVGGRAHTFGYLTQGASAGDVPASLRGLVKASLESYLEERDDNDVGEAARVVEGLGRAFPNMQGLMRYDRGAQAMLVGFLPQERGMHLKVYFNTRMLVDGAHRQRVISLAHGPGFDPQVIGEAYDALYDAKVNARFKHVGLDVDGSRRVKLYVRVDTSQALAHAEHLAQRFGIELDAGELRSAYAEEHLAGEVELALAFRPAAGPTLKWTYFFASERDCPEALRGTEALLARRGASGDLLRQAVETLRVEAGTRVFPLHGVGLEFPEGSRRKVNLYLSPGF